MRFNDAFDEIGFGQRRIHNYRKLLTSPRGIDLFFGAVLYTLKHGSPNRIMGATSSMLWAIHEYDLMDLALDEKRYARYEQVAGEKQVVDELDVLFPEIATEETLLQIWLAVDAIDNSQFEAEELATNEEQFPCASNAVRLVSQVDCSSVKEEEEAEEYMFFQYSQVYFENALLRRCLMAILRHRDPLVRADCALLFRAVCSTCFIKLDSANRFHDRVVRFLDRDGYCEEFGVMYPVILNCVKRALPNQDVQGSDESSSSHV